jgi:hypothetical protein
MKEGRMCCFNGPVDHVWATRIFVGAAKGKQITVYAANILGSKIEMVLPVRTRGAKEIEFVDLKAFPDFFLECERAFLRPSRAATKGQAAGVAAPPQAYLEVKQVGDYKVSFAPSSVDLERADPRVFKLSRRLKDVLTAHYPKDQFGYVIYKQKDGGAMHPLAYRHAIREKDTLFVPTRHEHGHAGPPDWDHFIYHQGDVGPIRKTSADRSPDVAGATFRKLAQDGRPVPKEMEFSLALSKLVRHGNFPNEDIEIRPVVAASIAPVAVGGAAVVGAAAVYRILRKRKAEESPASDT